MEDNDKNNADCEIYVDEKLKEIDEDAENVSPDQDNKTKKQEYYLREGVTIVTNENKIIQESVD